MLFFFSPPFTIDIDSLYTNINTQMGLRVVSNIFQRYPDAARPDAAILRLLDICLVNNDFQFDNRFHLQMEGTAMGQRFTPSYANIYMSEWEREALAKCSLQPVFYLRFIDDIIGTRGGYVPTVRTHLEFDFREGRGGAGERVDARRMDTELGTPFN